MHNVSVCRLMGFCMREREGGGEGSVCVGGKGGSDPLVNA